MQRPASLRDLMTDRADRIQLGTYMLLLAGLVVAIAIASDGAVSRAVNGVAGILWVASAWVLANALRRDDKFWTKLLGVTAICLVLVIFIRPSDLLMALAGFGIAGAIVAAASGSRGFVWATLLPALWLPVHLGTAVVKAVYRAITDQEATIRSDPPPTAAIVPFTMIVAAMFGAWLFQRIRTNRNR